MQKSHAGKKSINAEDAPMGRTVDGAFVLHFQLNMCPVNGTSTAVTQVSILMTSRIAN